MILKGEIIMMTNIYNAMTFVLNEPNKNINKEDIRMMADILSMLDNGVDDSCSNAASPIKQLQEVYNSYDGVDVPEFSYSKVFDRIEEFIDTWDKTPVKTIVAGMGYYTWMLRRQNGALTYDINIMGRLEVRMYSRHMLIHKKAYDIGPITAQSILMEQERVGRVYAGFGCELIDDGYDIPHLYMLKDIMSILHSDTENMNKLHNAMINNMVCGILDITLQNKIPNNNIFDRGRIKSSLGINYKYKDYAGMSPNDVRTMKEIVQEYFKTLDKLVTDRKLNEAKSSILYLSLLCMVYGIGYKIIKGNKYGISLIYQDGRTEEILDEYGRLKELCTDYPGAIVSNNDAVKYIQGIIKHNDFSLSMLQIFMLAMSNGYHTEYLGAILGAMRCHIADHKAEKMVQIIAPYCARILPIASPDTDSYGPKNLVSDYHGNILSSEMFNSYGMNKENILALIMIGHKLLGIENKYSESKALKFSPLPDDERRTIFNRVKYLEKVVCDDGLYSHKYTCGTCNCKE